ncbi:MAG TPA: phage baseplate assembly protein V [Thermoanaerobaculia bacterium]|nr:phage baseplate assembly protein V [Thermoanaerobaculia bacterium]
MQGNGVLIGIVSDLEDPERLGRVKVRYPTLGDQESDWARLIAAGAGKERGLFSRPEVGDEVVVVFEQGDPHRAYVLGGVWSKTDPPPPDDGNAADNNWRFIQSRSGHVIKLDDTQGAELIEIVDKDGQRRVVLDSANRKIQVICDQGDVEVTAGAGTVKVEATTVEIKATGNLTVEAGGLLKIKGATVDIN